MKTIGILVEMEKKIAPPEIFSGDGPVGTTLKKGPDSILWPNNVSVNCVRMPIK